MDLIYSITHLPCDKTSYNPNDIELRYCGFCHRYHEPDETLILARPANEMMDIDAFNKRLAAIYAHHEDVPKDAECVIVGGPWPGSVAGSAAVPGSVRMTCDRCFRFLAIAPATQDMMAGRTAATTLLCPDCARRQISRETGIPL